MVVSPFFGDPSLFRFAFFFFVLCLFRLGSFLYVCIAYIVLFQGCRSSAVGVYEKLTPGVSALVMMSSIDVIIATLWSNYDPLPSVASFLTSYSSITGQLVSILCYSFTTCNNMVTISARRFRRLSTNLRTVGSMSYSQYGLCALICTLET